MLCGLVSVEIRSLTNRIMEHSFPRLFVPIVELSFSGTNGLWTIPSLDHLFPGMNKPWTFRSSDHSFYD